MCRASSTCWEARKLASSSLSAAITSPANLLVILFSHHQRGQRPVNKRLVSLIECVLPLDAVGCEVD
jgi:hypothetical protein